MIRQAATQSQTAPLSLPSRIHSLTINLGTYAIALLIIWLLVRDISIRRFAQSLLHARFSLFIPAAIALILFWFIGDTITYARLFSYLQVPTRFREMLPGDSRSGVSPSCERPSRGSLASLVYPKPQAHQLVSRRRHFGILGFVDLQVLAAILLLATLMKPKLLWGIEWYYPAAFFAISCTFITSLIYSRSRLRIAQWIYGRSLLTAIRQMQLIDYINSA